MKKSITAPTKKPNKIQVAKMKAADSAEKKLAGILVQKVQPQFSTEEEVFICRAFVNNSCDPVTGTDQKGSLFWKKVADQVQELYLVESDVSIVGHIRSHIQPDVFMYNKFHLAVSTPKKSG